MLSLRKKKKQRPRSNKQVTAIPHGAIADLCVASLRYPNAGRATLTAMQSDAAGAGAPNWGTLLEVAFPK